MEPPTDSPDASPEANRTISVPKAYPMRSLLDYGEEEDDESDSDDGDEVIGPMPLVGKEEEGKGKKKKKGKQG